MERVALSVDFDFFARESAPGLYPTGEHYDGLLHHWLAVYGKVDLYKEADPARWADFAPGALWKALASRGVVPGPKLVCAVAESHALAWDWFSKERAKFDSIVHIDAHHDCFRLDASKQTKKWEWPYRRISAKAYRAGVHAGNWLTTFEPSRPMISLYPKWKKPVLDGRPHRRNARLVHWKNWRPAPESRVVTAMFVSRSGPWVPPHLDPHFAALVEDARRFATIRPLEDILIRTGWAPTRAEAARLHRRAAAGLNRLRLL